MSVRLFQRQPEGGINARVGRTDGEDKRAARLLLGERHVLLVENAADASLAEVAGLDVENHFGWFVGVGGFEEGSG
jgi:hypothetical protein